MSYSFSGKGDSGELVEWTPQPQVGYGEAESTEDLATVKALVEQIVAMLGGECTVTGGGHSNPNRTPEGSWATDMVNISVTRAKAVATE